MNINGGNMANKTFRQLIRKEFQNFFLWLVKRFVFWTESMLEWFERLLQDSAEDFRVYIIFMGVLTLEALIFLLQQYLLVPESKVSILGDVYYIVLLGSASALLIQAAAPIINRLGLEEALVKIRNKILEILHINDKK